MELFGEKEVGQAEMEVGAVGWGSREEWMCWGKADWVDWNARSWEWWSLCAGLIVTPRALGNAAW